MSGREPDLRRRDARARRLSQTVFDRPLVLEAGAGTGKTAALVARILAWGLGPGWERARGESGQDDAERLARRVLSRVVAITFTEAAAAEMGARLGEALYGIEQGSLPPGLDPELLPDEQARRRRARALGGALDHLQASTIHAWCRRLLRTHPLDAGLHTRLEVDADGRLRQEIVREVLDERLRDAYAAGDPRLLALAAGSVGPREIEVEILALLDAGLPARGFEADPFSEAAIRALVGRLEKAAAAVCQTAADLAGVTRARVPRETLEGVGRVRARLAEGPVESRAELEGLRDWLQEHCGDAARKKLAAWGQGKLGVAERRALGPRADALAEPAARLAGLLVHLGQIDVERLDLGRQVFGELLGHVEQELRRRGIATFHDLIAGASELLTGRPQVAREVASRIDQLLVDEFQDTDARQCDLLRAVALGGPRETRPGLFVVGDPKQSIYGWRSADLSAYDAFVADAVEAGGSRQTLHLNYRSVPRVLDEVERVVAPVMRERTGVQPRFEPLLPSPENAAREGYRADGRRPCEYWVSAARDEDAGGVAERTSVPDASRIEAEALARELRELHERGVPWGAHGVLFRTRSDWDLYLTVLREHDIPFAVEGDRSYYRRREIVDASAWVRCVLDPNDALALLTLLRCSAVGVPDAALIPLWDGDLPRRMAELQAPEAERLEAIRLCAERAVAQQPAGVPGLERVAGWERNLVALAESLAELRLSARRDAVDVFVEKLRTSLLLEASEAARYQGLWRAANLDRFFRDLLADLDGGSDFHRVLRRLRAAVAEEQDAEEGRPREILADAVQVMTIHGAKGLDFEHVYLMQLHKGPPPRRPASVEHRSVEGRLEYRVLGAPSAGWDLAERERRAVEEAERVRTLYVGMTRAKQRLVLAGLWPSLARGASGRMIDEVAAGLGDGAAVDALCEGATREGPAQIDGRDARWWLPALAPIEGPVRTGAREDVALPGAADVAADSERLARARSEARERMERPLGMAASEDPAARPEARGWTRSPETSPARSGAAAAVGTAVHLGLEAWDPAAAPDAELARVQSLARLALETRVPAAERDAAAARADALLERFASGALGTRLREIGSHVVARELPVLLPPAPDDEALGYLAGSLDLVYAEPGSGRLVVVDYKTGARGDHALQGARYTRALREALDLDYMPRFELWYLEEDAVVAA